MLPLLKNELAQLIKKNDRIAPSPVNMNSSVKQLILKNQYKIIKHCFPPAEIAEISETDFQIHSQFAEGDLLLYIFSLLGVTNRRDVEICAGNGTECMAAHLLINHGRAGRSFDGNEKNILVGVALYHPPQMTSYSPLRIKHAWITQENINWWIQDEGRPNSIDLLSWDIDGNNYYIWATLSVVTPGVVICETSNYIPPDLPFAISDRGNLVYTDGKQPREFKATSHTTITKQIRPKALSYYRRTPLWI